MLKKLILAGFLLTWSIFQLNSVEPISAHPSANEMGYRPVSLSVSQVDKEFQFAYFNLMTDEQRSFVAQYAPNGIRKAILPDVPFRVGYVHVFFPGTVFLHLGSLWNQSSIVNGILHEALHLRYYFLSGGTSWGEHIDIYHELINLTAENPDERINQLALVTYLDEFYKLKGCATSILINSNGTAHLADCVGKEIRY